MSLGTILLIILILMLGLRTQRRIGIGCDHHSDLARNGAAVIGDSYRLGRQTMWKPAFRT